MSSLFQETIRPAVQKQLKIREAIIKQGNDGGSRFSRVNLGPELGGETTLPPGAFYTYTTSRQCVIRMCSGVDLLPDTDIPELTKFEPKGALDGENLAIRYILEGGIQTKNIDFGGLKTAREKGKIIQGPRGGFPGIPNQPLGQAQTDYGRHYGDPYIRSDAKEDMGIVPMPGIIDAQIRTQTTYGSLRTAKVNFKCHNRRQLEVLELLYMRIGYPILLEWGWSTFVTNDGTGTLKVENEFPLIYEFFEGKSTQQQINEKILKNKEKTGFNYDGFLGICKNFEIISRPDGGFDCTTEIIAMGEVLEGLKGRNGGKYVKNEDKITPVTHLEYYLYALKEYAESVANLDETGGFNGVGGIINRAIGADVFLTNPALYEAVVEIVSIKGDTSDLYQLTPENIEAIEEADAAGVVDTDQEISPSPDNPYADMGLPVYVNKELDRFQNSQLQLQDIMDKFILYKGERLSLEGNEGELEGTKSAYNYIRWDFFCDILNKFVINRIKNDPKASKAESIVEITYYENPLGKASKDRKYATYSTFRLKKLKNKFLANPQDPDGPKFDLEQLMDMSVDPSICILPHQFSDHAKFSTIIGSGISDVRSIGKIFFNIDYLFNLYKDQEGENFNLFTYIKTIWNDVNNACAGTHDFEVLTELERPNVIKISDLIVQNDAIDPKELYEFKIQSNESIVRDFNISSTIPSALASTAAVTAQAKSIDSLDNVSFAAINKNIRNRFSSNVESRKSDQDIISMRNQYDRDRDTLGEMLKALKQHRIDMLRGQFLEFNGKGEVVSNSLEIANARYILRNVERLVRSILARHKDDVYEEGAQRPSRPKYYKGESKPNITPPAKSAIIPLQFNALIDGISGMVIGQVFKVDNTRLPKGYQGDDIAFIVFSEGQTITAGQDWTTEFSGKLVSLDLGKEIDEEELILTEGGYDNQFNNEQDLPETEVTKTTEGELDNINKVEDESGEVSDAELTTDSPFKGSEEAKLLVEEYKKVNYYKNYAAVLFRGGFSPEQALPSVSKDLSNAYYNEFDVQKRLRRLAQEAGVLIENYVSPEGNTVQKSKDRQAKILNDVGVSYMNGAIFQISQAEEALERIIAADENIREESLELYRSLDYPMNLKMGGGPTIKFTSPQIYTRFNIDERKKEYTDYLINNYDI